jgi:hypothetical protein
VVPHINITIAAPTARKFVIGVTKRLLQHYQGQSGKHLLALSFSAFAMPDIGSIERSV